MTVLYVELIIYHPSEFFKFIIGVLVHRCDQFLQTAFEIVQILLSLSQLLSFCLIENHLDDLVNDGFVLLYPLHLLI